MTISRNQLIEAFEWRYATKKFDSNKKISAQDWEALEKTLILSPSSYGLQPWKFLDIQDLSIRKKLTPASWNQTQVEDASHYVVFTTKTNLDEAYITKFIERTATVRGMPASNLDGYKNAMIGDLVKGPRGKTIAEWSARQAYIALGNLMTAAALLGIDTCPMEGIDPAKYDEILNLKDTGYKTICACAVGYRSADDKYAQAKKVRFEQNEVIAKV